MSTPEPRVQYFAMRGGTWKCKECRAPLHDGLMIHEPGCAEGAGAENPPAKPAARKEER